MHSEHRQMCQWFFRTKKSTKHGTNKARAVRMQDIERGAVEAFLLLSLLSLHVMCICVGRFLCPEANYMFLNFLAFEVWMCFSSR